mmetsp:Transcript_5655/g.10155  ORF Transcript_5655/g.10155 Transcript_5655/m.10155 type:complete len:222 (+) Transcript_5655:167-832(+)
MRISVMCEILVLTGRFANRHGIQGSLCNVWIGGVGTGRTDQHVCGNDGRIQGPIRPRTEIGLKERGSVKHFLHGESVVDVPIVSQGDIWQQTGRSTKHGIEILGIGHIPTFQTLSLKGRSVFKHALKAQHLGNVPCRHVKIYQRRSMKHVNHTFGIGNVPSRQIGRPILNEWIPFHAEQVAKIENPIRDPIFNGTVLVDNGSPCGILFLFLFLLSFHIGTL